MRNPKWHREEIILTLDLYFKISKGQIHSSNPKVIELSNLLNKLPIYPTSTEKNIKFRNPNGVSLKLSNFLAIDTDYREGMKSHSKLDKEIFQEFNLKRELLTKIADRIKIVTNSELNDTLKWIENEASDTYYEAKEGGTLLKYHKYRERNQTLIRKKKDQYFKRHNNLACEQCGFDFEKTYGAIGKGFIECHHKTPLAELNMLTITSLDDLMLVCSNCHRMMHRKLN